MNDDFDDDEVRNENGNFLLEGEAELWRGGGWRVTSYVLEEIHDGTTAGPPYYVYIGQLSDPELVGHVCQKTWVDREAFVEAYRKACELHDVTPVGLSANDEPLVRGTPITVYEAATQAMFAAAGADL